MDFGLKTFLTLSDENKIDSPLYLLKSLSNLRKLSRRLSTKKKGSNNRKKARLNLEIQTKALITFFFLDFILALAGLA